jgi:hypothetical protein
MTDYASMTTEELLQQEPLASLIADGLLINHNGTLLVPGDLTAEEEAELGARLQDPRAERATPAPARLVGFTASASGVCLACRAHDEISNLRGDDDD